MNATRPKVLRLLTDPTLTLVGVEHQDRLTRFGFNDIEQWLTRSVQDRRIEVVNVAENGNAAQDLIQDFVSSITAFCARL